MTTPEDLETLLTWGEETATLAFFGIDKAMADALVDIGTAVYAVEDSSNSAMTADDIAANWEIYYGQQPIWNNYDENDTEANANFVRFVETSNDSIMSALSDWGQTLLEASLGIPLTLGDKLDNFGMGLDVIFDTIGGFFNGALDALDGLLTFIETSFGTLWNLFVEGLTMAADLMIDIVTMDTEGIVDTIMSFVDVQETISKKMLEKEAPV